MTNSELVKGIQKHVARVSISASTVRGQGPSGIVVAVREHLGILPLRQFGVSSERLFKDRLESATTDLMKALPTGAKTWGLARKCINIFLRDAFYNHYLREAFRLEASESFYEVPLDRLVAKKLKRLHSGWVPDWRTIKQLDAITSEQYQAAANDHCQKLGISRVCLDSFFWGVRT